MSKNPHLDYIEVNDVPEVASLKRLFPAHTGRFRCNTGSVASAEGLLEPVVRVRVVVVLRNLPIARGAVEMQRRGQ